MSQAQPRLGSPCQCLKKHLSLGWFVSSVDKIEIIIPGCSFGDLCETVTVLKDSVRGVGMGFGEYAH